MSQSRQFTTVEDNLFGTLAVRYNFVLEQQVNEALEIQQRFYITGQPAPKLGEILAQKGYISHEQIAAVLRGQSTGTPRKRFGEIAVSHHFCSQQEVDAALKVQKDLRGFGQGQKLGEILVARGALRPHQVTAILQNQGVGELVNCPSCRTALNIAGLSPSSQVRCPSCNIVFVPSDLAAPAGAEQPHSGQVGAVTRHQHAATASRNTQIGSIVGQYQIESKLGEDSTGILYKAFDPQTGARVALRMLDPGMVTRQDDYERWVSAEQAARELAHRNLQRILAMNTDHGRPYLVMDFIDGDSLRKIMQRRGIFPAVDAIGILVQLAEALEYGASRGLLHGDLRPVHVLLGVDGVVRLSGLGIPKNAAQNLRQMAGQFSEEALPLYTPPEVMIDPEQADERSDIYSLGAIGYHMLTGRPPHEGTGLVQLGFRMAASKITPARETNPRIPEFVSKLVGRCLQLDANARYDSPTLLLNDLRKAHAALMAGEDAEELTESLSTNNYIPVEARRAPRLNRLKRLKTHMSRPAHAAHGAAPKRGAGKGAGASNAKMAKINTPLPPLPPLPGRGSNVPVPGATGSGLSPAVMDNRAAQGRGMSGIVPSVGVPSASSSTSIPAVVPTPGELHELDASSSALTAAINGIPYSMQVTPQEDISDLGDEIMPGTVARRHGDAGYEVVKQLDVKEDPITGSARIVSRRGRSAQPPKRFSNSTIVTTCVISAVVICAGFAGIYYSYAGGPEVPVVDKNDKLLSPTIIKPEIHSPEVEEAQDWHNFEIYSKDNLKNPRGMVDHLRLFVGAHPSGEHAAKANEELKQYADAGAEQSLPSIRETMQGLLKNDGFADANTAIEKWREEWKEAKDIAALEKSLKDEAVAGQKSSAQTLMDNAAHLRKEQKYAEAKAIYDRIKLNFPAEYKNLAAKAQNESEIEQQAAKNAAAAAEKSKKDSEERAARNGAAPAIFDRLAADVSLSYKTFDIAGAALLLDTSKDQLIGTDKEADFTKLKHELEQMTALRKRMAKAIKDGKMRDQRVKYHEQQCVLPDATEDGPILQVGAGTVPVKWSQVNADDLSDIAARATDAADGEGLLQVGMLRYYTGKYIDAYQVFSAAQKLKVDASRWMEMTQAALKDNETRDEKAKEAAAAEAQAETVKLLAASGLEIRHGIWRSNGNVFQVSQDPKEPKPDLMSLQRKIKRTFKSISIEVRGTGDSAGFSFSGEGRHFVVKPNPNWQKVTIERGATGVIMKVDDEETPSIEKIAFGVTPSNLVSDGIIYIRFIGQKGEFRNLQVDE